MFEKSIEEHYEIEYLFRKDIHYRKGEIERLEGPELLDGTRW